MALEIDSKEYETDVITGKNDFLNLNRWFSTISIIKRNFEKYVFLVSLESIVWRIQEIIFEKNIYGDNYLFSIIIIFSFKSWVKQLLTKSTIPIGPETRHL